MVNDEENISDNKEVASHDEGRGETKDVGIEVEKEVEK